MNLKPGDRIVRKDEKNEFENSWEVMSEESGVVPLGGPGYFESMTSVGRADLWNWVRLVDSEVAP